MTLRLIKQCKACNVWIVGWESTKSTNFCSGFSRIFEEPERLHRSISLPKLWKLKGSFSRVSTSTNSICNHLSRSINVDANTILNKISSKSLTVASTIDLSSISEGASFFFLTKNRFKMWRAKFIQN